MRRLRAAADRAKSTRRRCVAACFAFGIVAGGAACNPVYNWREVRSPDGYIVAFPGRPQTVSREVRLPDATVQMSMTSTGIGATLFAVGTARLPSSVTAEPAARQRTLSHLRDGLVRNVNGSITKDSAPTLAGLTGDPRKVLTADSIEATGRDSSGRAVQLAARWFIVEDRLFQVVALIAEGETPADVLDTFFASFRLVGAK